MHGRPPSDCRHVRTCFALLATLSIAVAARHASADATAPPGFVIEDAFPLTSFVAPLQIVFLPDGRRLIVEKDGKVWVGTAEGGKLATPLIDLTARVLSTRDRGLLSVAADPDFAINRWLYFLYTVDPDSNGVDEEFSAFSRIERYQTSLANPNVCDLSTRQILIGTQWSTGIPYPAQDLSHTIGTLRFGADKSLLVSSGDAAHFAIMDAGGNDSAAFLPGRTDPSEDIGAFRAQTIRSLNGKILRLDKETGLGLPSNPFWNGDPSSRESRVWAYGLRNPYRITVRPGTGSTNPADHRPGTLYIGDVGWGTWEELSIVPDGGRNLGWPCWEGPVPNLDYQGAPKPVGVKCDSMGMTPVNPSPLTLPALYWHHRFGSLSFPHHWQGTCTIGGVFYTGDQYPAQYQGRLFVGDYVSAWIRVVYVNDDNQVYGSADFIDGTASPVDLEVDPVTGDLYYVEIDSGKIRHVRYVTGNRDPIASATLMPTYGVAPLAVHVDASPSTDPEGQPLSYVWRFGNGDSATTAIATETYTEDGVYPVELEVTDAGGGVARLGFTVVVGQVPPPGTIVLPPPGTFFDPGQSITLQATPADPGPDPVTYRWDVDLVHNTHLHLSSFILSGSTTHFVSTIPNDGDEYSWRARLEVTRGALTTRDTVAILPHRDLAAFVSSVAPRTPREDRSFAVTAGIANIGPFPTPGVAWRLLEGAAQLASGVTPAMPAGEGDTLVIPLGPLSAGAHTLTMVADPLNAIVESDEANNSADFSFTVRHAGDPLIELRADRADGAAAFATGSTAGPWRDLVNGYDGALSGFGSGEPGWQGDGSPASPRRLELDGSDDRVSLPAPAELGATTAASAELWFRTGTNVTTAQTLLEWVTPASNPAAGMAIQIAGGALRVRFGDWVPVAPLEPSSWNHVVVSKDAAEGRVYLNGALICRQSAALLGPPGASLALGASTSGAESFSGAIAIARIYDSALNDAQAQAAYAHDQPAFPAPVATPDLLLELHADAASGTSAPSVPGAGGPWIDLAGGHNGALFGFDGTAASGWQGDGSAANPIRLVFDGIDSRVTIAAASVHGLQSRAPVTASMWVRTGDDVTTEQSLIEWIESFTGARRGVALEIANGALRVREGTWLSVAPIEGSSWHHVAVTQDVDQVAVYLDGQSVYSGTGPLSGAQLSEIALGAGLGAAPSQYERFFHGAIAEVEIRSGASPASAVEQMYEARAAQYVHRIALGSGCAPVGYCATIPVTLQRFDPTSVRGFRVDLELDPPLALCGAGIVEGTFLSEGGQTFFHVTPVSPGHYTVDGTILGLPCGAPFGGELFRVSLDAPAGAGAIQVEITRAVLRGCANQALAVDLPAPLTFDRVPPAPVSNFTAARVAAADADGTRPIALSFTLPSDASTVEIYRAGFGNYPEYDDPPNAGATPATPSYPPSAPWVRVTPGPGGLDETPVRDLWHYVAFAIDSCGNASSIAVAPPVLNYVLGDLRSAAGACTGDNAVNGLDLARLASRYGALLGAADPDGCLDIGPTLDNFVETRPTTDNRVDFEDFMMLALTYDASAPVPAAGLLADRVWLVSSPFAAVGDSFAVDLMMEGPGDIHGVSVAFTFDATRVQQGHVETGALLAAHPLPSAALSSGTGDVDVAVLGTGPGITGSGSIARIWFRVLSAGQPAIDIVATRGRGAHNQPIPLPVVAPVAVQRTVPSTGTWLAPPAPDPFSGSVTIRYRVPENTSVRLSALDVQGRRVRWLARDTQAAGEHVVRWDGRNDAGSPLESGLYFVRLDVGGKTLTRTVRLVR